MMIHWKRNGGHGPLLPHNNNNNTNSRPRNIPETIAMLLESPNSCMSMLQGHDTTIVETICSYSHVAVLPCNCCHDQAVAYCCRNQKNMACMLPMDEAHCNYSEELWQLISNLVSNGETVLQCTEEAETYREDADGSAFEKASSCSGGPTTYMIVTTSGFYSGLMNFCWKESVDQPFKFTGFLVGSASGSPTSSLQFHQKTWDDKGNFRRSKKIFDTHNPQLNQAFHDAIQAQMEKKDDRVIS